MIDRRAFIVILGALVAIDPGRAKSEQTSRLYKIGVLTSSGFEQSGYPWWDAFIQRMREHGWVEKRNFITEIRYTEGKHDAAVKSAKELAAQNVDLFVAGGTEATVAAKEATGTIPIVAFAMGDPVSSGLVESLARPGGNVTGTSFQGTELAAKQLELMKVAFPVLSKVAVLANPANASHPPRVKEALISAHALKVRLEVVEAHEGNELGAAFDAIVRNRDEALLVLTDPVFDREARRIASLARSSRIPVMYGLREHVVNGGLMSYGASFTVLFQQTADYVDKILRGAKPADLPIEQPTKFELVINLKTAKVLGLTIPQSLLLRADEVIQ